jgi:hypothetical protein
MFNNVGHALEWAYNTSAKPIVKMSGINHMRQTPTKGTPNELLINFSVHDRHAQAALIIGLIDGLRDQAEQQYIKARFGRMIGESDIFALVYRGCDAAGFGLGGQPLVYRVMHGYFTGRGVPYRAVRKVLGCRNEYALMVKSCLYEVLDCYHDRAMADMAEIFERQGLIRSDLTTTI